MSTLLKVHPGFPGCLLLILSLCFFSPLFAEVPADQGKTQEVRAEMGSVYGAFQRLWLLSIKEDAFLSGKNDKEISQLLAGLDTSFHSEKLAKSVHAKEPTFRFLLDSMGRMVEDARNRFAEGKRGYALWKVKTFSNYCITCHTRLEGASFDFVGSDETLAKVEDPEERAAFLLASRRFDKAAEAYWQIALSSNIPFDREMALGKWLVIKTRVEGDPTSALKQLEQYLGRRDLTKKEREELNLWKRGLAEWKSQRTLSRGHPSKEIARLLEKAQEKEAAIIGGGTIEYLRSTRLLHRELEKSLPAKEESERLYQIAVAYTDLPGHFSFELPEMFLERSIRIAPDTDQARMSFKLFERITLAAYSGSGGTFLPDDVKLHMKELEDLAYGVVSLSGKV